jgi:hypothetical protein
MPLVSPNDGIDIPFTSNADQVVAESKRVLDSLDRVKAGVKHNGQLLEQQAAREQAAIKKSTMSWTDFRSAYQTVLDVVRVGQQVFNATIKQHIEYADRVRQISTLSGESAESTSRFIQVLDDYKISAADALTATKALTKEGHTPSIETLAQLSDQYLALSSEQERNEFVLKNLGKGGLQWVEVLNKGSDAIREQGDAVADNLILNQKMLDDARRAEVAMDNWADAVEEVKTVFAVHLLPVLTDSADGILWLTKTTLLFFDAVKSGTVAEFSLVDALRQTREEIEGSEDAMLDSADAADGLTNSNEDLTDSSEDVEKAAKALSNAYEGLLSTMFAINDEQDSYQEKVAELTKESEDLVAEKDRLTLAMWKEKEAGKLTNDEYDKYIQNMAEITEKQEENAQAITDAASDHEKAAKQRVYDLAQERFAADGVIDSGEFEYLQQIAVQKGLVSKAAADQAIAESQAADELIANFQKTQPVMNDAYATMMQIAAMDGRIVNFGVNFTQSGNPYSGGGNGLGVAGVGVGGSSPGSGGSRQQMRRRDSGGWGRAGEPYLIGTGAQPEMFIPETNGRFVPNADKAMGGSDITIIVHNPRRETAENSIRRELKYLSQSGALP